MENKYIGYWNEILKDGKLLPDYDEILEDTYDGTELCVLDFLHGYCTLYSYWLWTQDNRFKAYELKQYDGQLVHAYCTYYNPQTKETWYLDIRGATTDAVKFFEKFEAESDEYGEVDENWFYIYELKENEVDEYVSKIEGEQENIVSSNAKVFAHAFMTYDFPHIA